jgi:uncharacterized protein involved in exopolysaccharide biosynthesis
MLRTSLLSLALSAALLALGCGNHGAPTAATANELADAKATRQDAADKSAVAASGKEKYARDMRKRLDGLESKYTALRDRAAGADGRAKRDLDRQVEVVKVKRDAASRKLDALRDSGSDGWQKAKEEFETILADLNAEFEKSP